VAAVTSIGTALQHGQESDTSWFVTSTVMPGATVGPIRDALERSSGLTVGEGIGLCYSPEFIAWELINDLSHPEMLLLGSRTRRPGMFFFPHCGA